MKKTPLSITEAEILSEIEGAIAVSLGPKEARTMEEIREAKGWSRDRAYLALKALGKQGRLMVHQVQRVALDGQMRWRPAYTVVPATKKSSRATRPR